VIDTHRMLPQSWRGRTALALGVVVLAMLPYFATPYYVGLLTSAMIAAMLALGVHLLVGATGLVTLGHGAFYGLAAYTVYLISPENTALPIWVTLPAAMATACVAALIVGSLALRTRGFFFLMVTLAFGQMIFFVFHDTKLGGGTDGAYLAKPLIAAFGFELNPTSFPRARRAWPVYYVALIQLVAIYLVLAFLLRSMLGRVLEGIKVNEPRMRALGFNTYRYKLAAFAIAGMFAGAAGHMWSLHTGFVNPELVGWQKSAEALLIILLGGIGSLSGAVVGAFAFYGLAEVAQLVTERKLLVEGFVILFVVILLRGGLTGFRLPRWRRKAPAPDAASEARVHG
jgi:branched-chain amino acid transport system permease protein